MWKPSWICAVALCGCAAPLLAQAPPAPPPGLKIYLLLKAPAAQAGEAREAFAVRMGTLGATNLQFVAGVNAAKCEAPVSAVAAIAQDADVAGILPLEGEAPVSPQSSTTAPPPASISPIPPTPPFAGMPQNMPMPMPGGVPMGGGMSIGMAALTDFASGVVVKMLSPGQSCKIRLAKASVAAPATGGGGAIEVRASGNCAWQAVSTSDWLKVKNNVYGSGTSAVSFTVTANATGHRQAAILIQPLAGTAPVKGRVVQIVAQD